jgi:hypothetical protein
MVFEPEVRKYIYLKNKTRQICEIINADIHPLQNLKVMKFLTDQFQLSEEQKIFG